MADGIFFDQPGEMEAKLLEWTDLGVAGLDATVIALTEVARQELQAVLTEKTHQPGTPTPASRGGPPAAITKGVAESVKAKTVPTPGGMIGRAAVTDFRAKFLNDGWRPNGSHRRRSARERRQLTQKHGQAGKVAFPFVEDARDRVQAAIPAAVAAHITFR